MRTLVVLMTLCGSALAANPPGMQPSGKLETTAPSQASRALLQKIQGYPRWPTFAENGTPKRSKSHWKLYVVTFHNDVVTRAIQSHTLPLPDGSILVKENRPGPNAAPTLLTVMSKQNGRWYWLASTPGGQVVKQKGQALEGDHVSACQDCHEQQTDNDSVYTHDFKK